MHDLISRQAAIEAAFDYRVDVIENDYDRGYQKAVRDIAKELNSILAADVAPVKRGEWVFKHHKMMGKTPCCSECGKFEPIIRNFCPNCGADMREVGTE